MRTIALHHGVEIPVLGFGTWKLTGEECMNAVREALAAGYRHIDTALLYGNHREIAHGIEQSDVAREDVFLTSKIWCDDLSPDGVERQMDQILNELQTDYMDLTLIHWPNSEYDMPEAIKSLEEQRRQGKTRAIGVSNFTSSHLEPVLETGINISMNQVEYHPSLNQEELHQFCTDRGIALTAYSPLAQGNDLDIPNIKELADIYDVSPAQVIINWMLSKDIIAIPRSKNPYFIRDNMHALDWQLEHEDILLINQLSSNNRLINPPFVEF